MTYQKARFIEKGPGHHLLWGKEIWVETKPPTDEIAQDFFSHEVRCSPAFSTAVKGPNELAMLVEANCVELFPEFQDDVLIVPFSRWMKENRIKP